MKASHTLFIVLFCVVVISVQAQAQILENPIKTLLSSKTEPTKHTALIQQIERTLQTPACKNNSDCIFLGEFSLGYYHAKLNTVEQQLTAEQHYKRALTLNPSHKAALHNITNLLSKQKRANEAARYYVAAAELTVQPNEKISLLIKAGDLAGPQEPETAVKIYLKACDYQARCDIAKLRIIGLLGNLAVAKRDRLMQRLRVEWSDDSMALLNLREKQAALLAESNDSLASEQELADIYTDWLIFSSQTNSFSKDKLREFSRTLHKAYRKAGINSRPLEKSVREIQRFQNTGHVGGLHAFVGSRPLYKHAMGYVILDWGFRKLETQPSPNQVAFAWERAIYEYLPRFDDYAQNADLNGLDAVRTEFYSELAALFYRHPDIDPDNRRFKRLVNDIFRSKTDAPSMNDLASIQKHHTILGLIYKQRPELEGSRRYESAQFQLANAVKAADKRAAQGEAYQPLPGVIKNLAESCEKTFNNNYCKVRNSEANVAALYAEASKAYLDENRMKPAKVMIKNLDRHASTEKQKQNLKMLNTVYKIRTDTDKGTNQSENTLQIPNSVKVLESPEIKSMDESFINRQLLRAQPQLLSPDTPEELNTNRLQNLQLNLQMHNAPATQPPAPNEKLNTEAPKQQVKRGIQR